MNISLLWWFKHVSYGVTWGFDSVLMPCFCQQIRGKWWPPFPTWDY